MNLRTGVRVRELGQEAALGVGVGVFLSGDQDQRHVALLYCVGAGRPVRMLHLAWHHRLMEEEAHGEGVWARVPLEPEDDVIYAGHLAAVARANARGVIPYGFQLLPRGFDPASGAWRGAFGEGLTCATFVASVLASFGYEILIEKTWYVRAEDVEWQQKILGLLRGRADLEYVAHQARHVGRVARFRPEEVAVAAASSDVPLGFARAEPRGKKWVEMLTQVA